jgi:hypothetical protein
MYVCIDENPANPRRYPGDYEAQPRFEVTAEGPERLIVDLPRLIHLTRPGDNGLGDLLSAWPGHPRGDPGERQFFKAAYQGILDHSDDPHIVASAVQTRARDSRRTSAGSTPRPAATTRRSRWAGGSSRSAAPT